VETVCRNVKRWRAGDHIERWVGSGLLVAERQFHKVQGYRGIPALVTSMILIIRPCASENDFLTLFSESVADEAQGSLPSLNAVVTGPTGEPLSGMAYRVGIRNNGRTALRGVLVTIELPDAKPATARFAKDKSYSSDVEPRSTELVEVFMLRDQDQAQRIVQTVKIRVGAADTKEVSKTFRFDSKAPVPLVPM